MAATFGGVAGTGRPFRIDQAVITHLRDGKVQEAWEIADIASLRDQVGEGWHRSVPPVAAVRHLGT